MSDQLTTFTNPTADKPNISVQLEYPEFSVLCPTMRTPNHAVLKIVYCPRGLCVEHNALQRYLIAYKDKYMSMEAATSQIHKDLVAVLSPRWLTLEAEFSPRNAMHCTIRCAYDVQREQEEKDLLDSFGLLKQLTDTVRASQEQELSPRGGKPEIN